MLLKSVRKQFLLFFISFLFLPFYSYAYSDKIIAGGDTVGIKLNTSGILVAGSYDINGHNSLVESGLNNGDLIIKINNKPVKKIDEMVKIIDSCNCSNLNITYNRDNEISTTTLNLYKEGNTLKTGLYVKDSISGVGTLTYIDPDTKLFGVLGHEIADSSSGNIISINGGNIFDSEITSITRSETGIPGEKNALLYSDKINGIILKNTNKGIFGKYTNILEQNKLYKVADISNIKLGKAKIRTVLKGSKIEEFDINILSVKSTKDKLKNIQFEVTDEKLLSKSNGIIQGMSGSPIIQGDYIIGAVTHVIVENPHKGYGILIKNMLEEGEN